MISDKSKKERNLDTLFALCVVLLFVLSVGFHDHGFSLSSDSERVSVAKPSAAGHSAEFCAACRLHGNLNSRDAAGDFSLDSFGVYLGLFKLDVLIPSSSFVPNQSPRSPPAV